MSDQRRWDDYFMDLAIRSAQMSYCTRLKVGTVAVKDRRPILSGWNGTSPGEDNCCEEWWEDGDNGSGWRTKSSVNHAERNLIEWAARKGISLDGATLYITHAPCIECAKSIRNAGIVEIVWKDVYRSTEGIEHLNNIKVRRYGN